MNQGIRSFKGSSTVSTRASKEKMHASLEQELLQLQRTGRLASGKEIADVRSDGHSGRKVYLGIAVIRRISSPGNDQFPWRPVGSEHMCLLFNTKSSGENYV